MKVFSLCALIIFGGLLLGFPTPLTATGELDLAIVEQISRESGVPNAVSGIIFRNRLYDPLFEVVVFI